MFLEPYAHAHTHTPCTDDSVGGTLAIIAQFPELSNRLRRGAGAAPEGVTVHRRKNQSIMSATVTAAITITCSLQHRQHHQCHHPSSYTRTYPRYCFPSASPHALPRMHCAIVIMRTAMIHSTLNISLPSAAACPPPCSSRWPSAWLPNSPRYLHRFACHPPGAPPPPPPPAPLPLQS